MEIKDLQREIMTHDRIAELGRIVLQQNEQMSQMQQKIAELEKPAETAA